MHRRSAKNHVRIHSSDEPCRTRQKRARSRRYDLQHRDLRDRSHYEHFRTYHSTLYKQVEPTSVTPWAIPVRKRALHALLVSMIRILGTAENASSPNPFPDEQLIEMVLEIIERRVSKIDNGESKAVLKESREFLEKWKRLLPSKYGSFGSCRRFPRRSCIRRVRFHCPNGTTERLQRQVRCVPLTELVRRQH